MENPPKLKRALWLVPQNPVVHFDFPLCLDNWFLRQRVRQKREEIQSLIMRMHQSQRHDEENWDQNKDPHTEPLI